MTLAHLSTFILTYRSVCKIMNHEDNVCPYENKFVSMSVPGWNYESRTQCRSLRKFMNQCPSLYRIMNQGDNVCPYENILIKIFLYINLKPRRHCPSLCTIMNHGDNIFPWVNLWINVCPRVNLWITKTMSVNGWNYESLDKMSVPL